MEDLYDLQLFLCCYGYSYFLDVARNLSEVVGGDWTSILMVLCQRGAVPLFKVGLIRKSRKFEDVAVSRGRQDLPNVWNQNWSKKVLWHNIFWGLRCRYALLLRMYMWETLCLGSWSSIQLSICTVSISLQFRYTYKWTCRLGVISSPELFLLWKIVPSVFFLLVHLSSVQLTCYGHTHNRLHSL